MNSSQSENGRATASFDKYLHIGIVVLTILVSALAMSPSVADPDLWGHVQFGRDVLVDGQIAATNPYTFTTPEYRWVNHENLSEIVMAWTVDNLGTWALSWGKLALSLFVIGSILWFNLRRGVGLVASCLLTILVAWNLGYHWSFRPQLSSFFFFTCMVLLLQWSFIHWRDNWHLKWFAPACVTRNDSNLEIGYSWKHSRLLWLAPVILCLWTNSHGGFVAGLCIYMAYLGLRTIEVVTTQWPNGWGLVRRMSLMMFVAVAAVFINPYSYQLPQWLIESLGQPRPEILDWSSDQLYGMIGLKFWALIAIVIASLALSGRSLDFTQTVILAITLWQAVSHFRHVPFFAILAGFWVGPHLHSVMNRFSSAQQQSSDFANSFGKRFAVIGVMVVLIGIVGWRLNHRVSQLRVEKDVFPVDAFQYMADHKLGGRLVVTYDWAQYAIGAFCVKENLAPEQPLTRVAFDGRFRTCYPQEIVDMHFDLLFADRVERHRSPNSPAIDPTKVLEHGEPDLVLVRRIGELSASVMEQQDEVWVKLYQDRLAQLWGRREVFDDPSSSYFIPENQRNVTDHIPNGHVAWPAFPQQKQQVIDQQSGALAQAEN